MPRRQGGGLRQMICPAHYALVAAGAAHIGEVALTVVIHRVREAQFDQIRHDGQVAQNVERPHVRMLFDSRGECDGSH